MRYDQKLVSYEIRGYSGDIRNYTNFPKSWLSIIYIYIYILYQIISLYFECHDFRSPWDGGMVKFNRGRGVATEALKKAKAKVQLDKDLDRAPGPQGPRRKARRSKSSGDGWIGWTKIMWLFEDVNFYPMLWPRCSMYGIFTYIWVIYGVNVGKYSIHGAYGWGCTSKSLCCDFVQPASRHPDIDDIYEMVGIGAFPQHLQLFFLPSGNLLHSYWKWP